MRREEEGKGSAHGSVRSDVPWGGWRRARKVIELMIFTPVHGCELDGLSGGCATRDADIVCYYPWWGGQQGCRWGGGRDARYVWRMDTTSCMDVK
jgi:hypothetical protein